MCKQGTDENTRKLPYNGKMAEKKEKNTTLHKLHYMYVLHCTNYRNYTYNSSRVVFLSFLLPSFCSSVIFFPFILVLFPYIFSGPSIYVPSVFLDVLLSFRAWGIETEEKCPWNTQTFCSLPHTLSDTSIHTPHLFPGLISSNLLALDLIDFGCS